MSLYQTGSRCKKYLSIEFSLFHFIVSMMIYHYGENTGMRIWSVSKGEWKAKLNRGNIPISDRCFMG